MDTSKEYIKMCEKAGEIQLLKREKKHTDTGKWKPGDYYTTWFPPFLITIIPQYLDEWADEPDYLHHPSENIWLPRQDQLQEMIQDNSQHYLNSVHQIWYEFAEYDGDGSIFAIPDYLKHIASMEQLWLAFVMKEKYNKIWNGKGWVGNKK